MMLPGDGLDGTSLNIRRGSGTLKPAVAFCPKADSAIEALVFYLLALWQPQQTVTALSPSQVILLASADVSQLPDEIAKYTRFLWLPNLTLKDRTLWHTVLNGHCNSLSSDSDLVPLRSLANGHLLALNLLDYGWKAETWEKFADSDPTFTATIVNEVREVLQEATPVITGTWQKVVNSTTYAQMKDGRQIGGWDSASNTYRPIVNGEWGATVRDYFTLQQIAVVTGVKLSEPIKTTKVRSAAPWLIKTPGGKVALDSLRAKTHSEVPVVNALLFFANTASSGLGTPDYYDMQGVKDEADFQKLVGAEIAKDVAFSSDLLAAIGVSGITQEPRAIQRIDKRGGALWRSFDKKRGTGIDKGNALRILGSDADGKLQLDFDATEQYAHGPNGLWKFLLANNKGVKQARAPDDVAQDKTAILHNNHSVLICVSCLRCHANGGLQDIDDWFRGFPPEMDVVLGDRNNEKALQYEEVRKLRRQYVRKLTPFLAQDRARYTTALLQITGMKSEEYATAFATAWEYAANPLIDSEWAAREIGTDGATLELAIKNQVVLKKADPVLATLVQPLGKRRLLLLSQWREQYGNAQKYLAEIGK